MDACGSWGYVLGNFLCCLDAERSNVALRVSMEVRSDAFGPSLSLFDSLARRTLMGWIWQETTVWLRSC